MPTYEYECSACGKQLEALQSFSEDPLKKCPKCKKNKLERLISGGAGFIFKGDGFYETDYRKEGYKKDAKDDKSSTGSDDKSKSKDKASTDKKPMPKTSKKKNK
jgi:putative FmdB family regulatory protein